MYDEIISQVSLFDLIGTNDDFVLYRAEEIKRDSEKKDSRNLVSRRFFLFVPFQQDSATFYDPPRTFFHESLYVFVREPSSFFEATHSILRFLFLFFSVDSWPVVFFHWIYTSQQSTGRDSIGLFFSTIDILKIDGRKENQVRH